MTEKSVGVTWFVSRHAGAIAWARMQALPIDRWVEHLDIAEIAAGDTVIGSLPVNLAASVCTRGARYVHLVLRVPAQWRGRELSSLQMAGISAELKGFHVEART